jgi:ABC-type transporter MlaC component
VCIFSVGGAKIFAEAEIDEKAAADFINGVVNESLEIVNNNGASDENKRKELSECINTHLDIERITKSVFAPLGYKDLSEAEKKQVQNYLKKQLISFYAGEGKLSAMVNAKLSSNPVAEKKGNDFAVTTKFEKNSNPSTTIVWVTNGKKVYYVEIEGINQIITLRSEMQAAVGPRRLMDYINDQTK